WALLVFVARLNPDGSLDVSFGGEALPGPLGSNETVGVVTTPDGELYLATATRPGLASQIISLTRFTAGGAIDRSFGTDGTASMPLPTTYATVSRVLRAPDGKFLFAGS